MRRRRRPCQFPGRGQEIEHVPRALIVGKMPPPALTVTVPITSCAPAPGSAKPNPREGPNPDCRQATTARKGAQKARCPRSRHRRLRGSPGLTPTPAHIADAEEGHAPAPEATNLTGADRARSDADVRANAGQADPHAGRGRLHTGVRGKLPDKTADRPGRPRRAPRRNTGSMCRAAQDWRGGPADRRPHTNLDQALRFRTAELRHVFAQK